MQLSVIIPIYNKSQNLSSLFNSLLHQRLEPDELEIILVNDGSTDHSEKLCSEFINSHPMLNVRYIYQNNAGVSAARNAGIDIATGDYIHFMDSDDTLVDVSYRYLLDKFALLESDYVGFGCKLMDVRNQAERHSESQTINGEIIRNVNGIELIGEALWPSTCVVGFYKRQFLLTHNVKFPIGISIGEDVWFNFDFFKNNPSCTLTSCRPYLYWFRNGTVMTTVTKEKAEKWFHSYHNLFRHLIDYKPNTPPCALDIFQYIQKSVTGRACVITGMRTK